MRGREKRRKKEPKRKERERERQTDRQRERERERGGREEEGKYRPSSTRTRGCSWKRGIHHPRGHKARCTARLLAGLKAPKWKHAA